MRLRPRYLVALLWHWSIPFCLGAISAYFPTIWAIDQLDASWISSVREICRGHLN